MAIVDHVVHKIDERNAGHDEQGTGQQGMIGSLRKAGERSDVGQTGGDKGRNGDTHVQIDAELDATGTHAETGKGTDGGKQEGNPVATEQLAETAAGKAGADGHDIRQVVALLGADAFQLFLVAVERIVVLDGTPGKLADLGDGGHVDAMLLALLKLGERMGAVADVDHQHGVAHVDVELLFGEAQVGSHTVHVTHDTVGIGSTLY